MSEIVPTYYLIRDNIEDLQDVIDDPDSPKRQAIEEKLEAILIIIANKLGIVQAAKPLLDIIFEILSLVIDFPCKDCCGDDTCPPEIKNPPSGTGTLLPIHYGDGKSRLSWKLYPISGASDILKIRPYMQDLNSQLSPQLDEPISIAVPAGSTNDAAHFRIRLFSKRASVVHPNGLDISVPIAAISDSGSVITTNRNLSHLRGVVTYKVEPNYDQLIVRGIVGTACDPEIEEAKDAVIARFGEFNSGLDRFPEAADIMDLYDRAGAGIVEANKNLRTVIDNSDLNLLQTTQDKLLGLLNDTSSSLLNKLNSILAKATDAVLSELTVDKNIVKSNGKDKAIITVIPRDATGTAIAKGLPNGVDITVNIFSDFGILQNQQRNNDTGEITAEILSPLPGLSNITAKINGVLVTDFGETETTHIESVRFVSDGALPKRRTGVGSKHRQNITSDSEPGNR